jgi:hypothetical protein
MQFRLRILLIVLAVGPMVLVLPILTVMVHLTHNRGHVITAPMGPMMERQRAEAELARSRLNSNRP